MRDEWDKMKYKMEIVQLIQIESWRTNKIVPRNTAGTVPLWHFDVMSESPIDKIVKDGLGGLVRSPQQLFYADNMPCLHTINIAPSAKRVLPPDSQQWNGGKLWSREHVGALNNLLYSLHSKVDMTGWWWRTCRPKFFEHVIMILKFSTSAGVRPPMVRTYIIHTLAILHLFSMLDFLWHFFCLIFCLV